MTARSVCFLIVTLVQILAALPAAADEGIEQALAATFRLHGENSSGTCFLVARERGNENNGAKLVLVTAAHVLEKIEGATAQLVLRSRNNEGVYSRLSVPLVIRRDGKPLWTKHPEMDLAAMPVELPAAAVAEPFQFDQLASEAAFANKHIRVSQQVWILCFPAQVEANAAGWAVLRSGTIASHPLAPTPAVRTMLVDFSTFGGDSGAPVIGMADEKLRVTGLVLAMHRQTDTSKITFEERTVHTPMGLSIVAQATFIRETIELLAKENK